MPCSLEEFVQMMKNEAADVPCDTCTQAELELIKPPWYDEKLFLRGRKYIDKNFSAHVLASLIGLVTILADPESLNILIHTKKSQTTISAYRRYMSTFQHVYSWTRNDLRPGSESWKSLLTVRKRHIRVNNATVKSGHGIITQRDLVITIFGFLGYVLLKGEELGMRVDNKKDIEAYIHFWRTVGFMVGIHDKYNFCDGSIDEVMKKAKFICEDYCKPYLMNPPEYYFYMITTFLDGLFYLSVLISTKPSLYLVYRMNDIPGFQSNSNRIEAQTFEKDAKDSKHNGIKVTDNFTKKSAMDSNSNDRKPSNRLDGERLFKSMTIVEKFLFFLMSNLLPKILRTWIGRMFYNISFLVTFAVARYVPYMAILKYGVKKSYVNMFVEDVADQGTLKPNQQVLEELYGKN